MNLNVVNPFVVSRFVQFVKILEISDHWQFYGFMPNMLPNAPFVQTFPATRGRSIQVCEKATHLEIWHPFVNLLPFMPWRCFPGQDRFKKHPPDFRPSGFSISPRALGHPPAPSHSSAARPRGIVGGAHPALDLAAGLRGEAVGQEVQGVAQPPAELPPGPPSGVRERGGGVG